MRVRQISPSDTYLIRQQVLRPGRDIATCYFSDDDKEQTLHLGAFIDKKLVRVASFFFRPSPSFESLGQYQLRGMATLPEFRGQGYSSELLKFGFPLIKRNFCDLVWCNARLNAIDFYQKVGFEPIGDTFDIPDVGVHQLMYKKVN